MVDVPRRDHDTVLLIGDELPRPDPVVVPEITELELRFAARGRRPEAAIRRRLTVLLARALRIELRAEGAVIALQCAEVTVGELDQIGARAALRFRDLLCKRGLVQIVRRVPKRTLVDAFATNDSFGLGNSTILDLQAQRHMGRLAVFFHGPVPNDITRGRIGTELTVRAPGGRRGPDSITDHHRDAVFRVLDDLGPFHLGRILGHQRIQILVGGGNQTIACAR